MVAVQAILFMLAYLVPSIIAAFRDCKRDLAILALNLLLGWTVLGWIAALIWALADNSRKSASEATSAKGFYAEIVWTKNSKTGT